MSEAYYGNTVYYNIDDEPSLEYMSRKVGVPYSIRTPTQRRLHDTIAANCKNILELQVSIAIPNAPINCREYLSASLFSLDHISKLEVSLWGDQAHRFDGMVVTRLIENLPKLQELSVKSAYRCSHVNRLHIESSSQSRLSVLNVSGMSKNHWISGVLPNLRTLIYHGGYGGNGIVPQFTNEQKLKVLRNVDGDYHYHAGQATIHNVTIPSTCEVIVQDYCGREILNGMSWALKDFLISPFETFE